MARPTKMIFITSNEDFVRELSLDRAKNTRIIELDDDDEHQIINTIRLSRSSQSNSNHDQIHKRVHDSSDLKSAKKSTTMICAICGNHAIGYNYDVLSCASCKAYFRRNAERNLEKMQCLNDDGRCTVAYGTRRKCQKCRLERCFAMGMRIEFFVTEEEKQRRREKSQENELDRLLNENLVSEEGIEEISFGALSIEDWIQLESIKSSFINCFQIPRDYCPKMLDTSNLTSALISWSEFLNDQSLRVIAFFRQIKEFEGLILDDRLILIKYNLFAIFPLTKCFNYKHHDDCCASGTNEAEKHRQFFMLLDPSNTIRDTFRELVISIVRITEQDPTILSLLVIILILTPGLSMDEEQLPINDPLAVNRIQSHYIELLRNYYVNQWGEMESCKRFTELVRCIFKMQSSTQLFRVFFRSHYTTSNTVDKITPLMQSVLNIS